MEPRAGVALWNITDSLDRVYHESRRSSPIRWSVESVDGNVNKTDQKRRPVPHHFVFERVGSQITGCSNLYPLNASQSVSKIWLLVFTVSQLTKEPKVPHANPGKTCFTHALKPNATLPDAHCHLLGDGRVGVRQYLRRRQRRACHDDDEAAQNHSNCRRTQVNR